MLRKGTLYMTSKEELEIYLKHVKPVGRGEMTKMKLAWVGCYAEVEREGLDRARNINGRLWAIEDHTIEPGLLGAGYR